MSFKDSFQNKSFTDADEARIAKDIEGWELPSLDMAYDESRRIIEIQVERIDAADSKSSVLVGLSGVILAAMLGGSDLFLQNNPSLFSVIFIVLSATSTVFSAAAGLRAYHLNPDFYISPSPRTFQKRYIFWKTEHVKYQFLVQLADITEANHALLSKKLRWISICLGFIVLSAVFIAISLVSVLL